MQKFVHCNKCTASPKTVRLALSSCFHILCSKCVTKGTCPICKKPNKLLPLDNRLHVQLKVYFMSPPKLLAEKLEGLMKLLDFQKSMSDHLLQHLISEREVKQKMESMLRSKDRVLQKQKNEIAKMEEWIKMAEMKLKLADGEKLDLERKVFELRSVIQQNESNNSMRQAQTPTTMRFNFCETDSELSSIARSSDSSFNLMSPIVNSPSPSISGLSFDEDRFAIPKTPNFHMTRNPEFSNPFRIPETPNFNLTGRTGINSDSFSAAFNSILAPSSNLLDDDTQLIDRTSISLENYHNRSSSSRSSSIDRRDSSLPTNTTIGLTSMRKSSKKPRYESEYKSRRESQFPKSVRELRRYASQPGIVTRKPIIPKSYLQMEP